MIFFLEKRKVKLQKAQEYNEIYRQSLEKEMLKKIDLSSKSNYQIGDFAKILIPKVDRQPLTPKFLFVKILEINQNNLYCVGCSVGILNRCYNNNDLEKVECKDFPELNNIPDIKLSLRTAVKQLEVKAKNLQDKKPCSCKTLCDNNRCSCKKNNQLCTLKCHNRKVCKNIIYK
jgi:hypothetical protein